MSANADGDFGTLGLQFDFFCCLRVAIKAEYEDNYKNLFISPLLVFYDTYLSGNVKYKKVAGY